MLQLITPYYKETPRQLYDLITSIKLQVLIPKDIRWSIVVDGTELPFAQEIIEKEVGFPVEFIHLLTNRGAGYARQQALDVCTADYVMFVDADDILYSNIILHSLDEMTKTNADMYWCKFFEEMEDGFIEKNGFSWLHGKVYSVKFLHEHNIRFDDNIRYNEDCYFNSLFAAYNPYIKNMDAHTIIWKNNPKSITRNGSHKEYENWISYVKYKDAVINELKKRKSIEIEVIKSLAAHTITELYVEKYIIGIDVSKAEKTFKELANDIYKDIDDSYYVKEYSNSLMGHTLPLQLPKKSLKEYIMELTK